MSDVVIRVEGVSKLYRLGEVGTGSLAHDVNRWWHRVRGKEDPYLKVGEVNDRTKPAKQARSEKNLTTIEHGGRCENEQLKVGPKGEGAGATESKGAAGAGVNQRADSAGFLEAHSQASLQMVSQKPASIRSANDSRASGGQTGLAEKSAEIGEICGKNSEKSAPSDWVYALKDVSFDVKRGEVLGIIGRNGAGKSTLLKILSRVTTQTTGQIKVKGRIASLLEVGTGFHPELTGRENIFLNGAILGMRKAEIARKFDEIVEFSGCARYIDTPVKRYSSGMYVRLAFAVAAHLEPEILIVDEVLAVGDAEFQKKCLGKMKDVAGEGRTVLFVTHQMSFITSISKNCIWMDSGTVRAIGPTIPIVQDYINIGNVGRSFERERIADSRATLTKGNYFTEDDESLTRMIFSFDIDASESLSASLDFRIKDGMLREVGFGSLGVFDSNDLLDLKPGLNQIKVVLDTGNLASGIYTLSVDLSIPEKAYLDRVENAMTFEVVRPNTVGHSRILQQAWGYGCWHVHLEKVAL